MKAVYCPQCRRVAILYETEWAFCNCISSTYPITFINKLNKGLVSRPTNHPEEQAKLQWLFNEQNHTKMVELIGMVILR